MRTWYTTSRAVDDDVEASNVVRVLGGIPDDLLLAAARHLEGADDGLGQLHASSACLLHGSPRGYTGTALCASRLRHLGRIGTHGNMLPDYFNGRTLDVDGGLVMG
jgi:hypothetical protein